jgi:tripartite-type tricarboxylate transporter receptor subunit TctC
MRIEKLVGAAAVAAMLASMGAHAASPQFPDKPIRLIIGSAPGSGPDIIARLLSDHLAGVWGQQVIVDSRPGVAGIISAEHALRANPDGYTWMMLTSQLLIATSGVYPNLKFDLDKDFVSVANIGLVPYILLVNPKLPVGSVPELIAAAKKSPGRLRHGSAGTGGGEHFTMEMFKRAAGIDMLHVPYKGAGIATIDVLSGQVQMFCTGLTALSAHIKGGRLRALGLASLKRSAVMPELPTIAEQGLPGFEVNSWTGLVAPAKTPQAIVKRLYAEVVRIVESQDMKDFLASTGAEPALMGPEEFRAYIKADIARYAPVVKAAGIKPE